MNDCLAFMIATTVVAPIAAGLLTTLDLDTQLVKALAYQGLLGFGIGLGIQGPQVAAQTVLSPGEISIGISLISFASGLGSSLFVSASSALFQNRLVEEVRKSAPGTNTTILSHIGLGDIRSAIGQDRLRDVLLGYDEAVTQTLYLTVALACLTVVGSAGVEWRSVKKKQS
jgi:hypothetical protein